MLTTAATLAAWASGFALMGYAGPPANVLATSIAINLSLAPLTAVVASRRNRSALRWSVAGLVLGMWALAAILVLAPHREAQNRVPPTSDAA